jgi:predicted permease
VIIGFVFALISPIRGLFVTTSSREEGTEPLRFLLETIAFLGSFAVPLGLINLGSALGRIKINNLLPLRYIFSIVLAKLFIIPAIGIVIAQLLTFRSSLISPDDKLLRFIFMFQVCSYRLNSQGAVPTANTLVFLTQYHSPNGEADAVAGVVLIEYIVSILTLPVI